MAPTIDTNDQVIVNPLAYSFDPIERFDIVVMQAPTEVKARTGQVGKDVLIIKRVEGLPGERVEIRNNELYVNDRHLDEPFDVKKAEDDPKKNFGPVTVPDNEYFVLGDSRPDSDDSRYFTHLTIKKQDIYSKVTEIRHNYYAEK